MIMSCRCFGSKGGGASWGSSQIQMLLNLKGARYRWSASLTDELHSGFLRHCAEANPGVTLVVSPLWQSSIEMLVSGELNFLNSHIESWNLPFV